MKTLNISVPIWDQIGINRGRYVALSIRQKKKMWRRLQGIGFFHGLWIDAWMFFAKQARKRKEPSCAKLISSYNKENAERRHILETFNNAYFGKDQKNY
jgi:hypothetical protein